MGHRPHAHARAAGWCRRGRWPRARRVYLLQRKPGKLGATLGKTTGWIHRSALKHRGVVMRNGVTYQRIDDAGLHISTEAGPELLAVEHVVICAGQESVNGLATELARIAASRCT